MRGRIMDAVRPMLRAEAKGTVPVLWRRARNAGLLMLVVVAAAAAATSRGSFEKAPYYDGKVPAGLGSVAHVAVAFYSEPGALDPTPARSPALAALVGCWRRCRGWWNNCVRCKT